MLDWNRGNHAGEGTTIIDRGATAILDGGMCSLEGSRNILNKGTLTQSGQAIFYRFRPNTTSTITNAAGAQWTATMDNGIGIAYPWQCDLDARVHQRGDADQSRPRDPPGPYAAAHLN